MSKRQAKEANKRLKEIQLGTAKKNGQVPEVARMLDISSVSLWKWLAGDKVPIIIGRRVLEAIGILEVQIEERKRFAEESRTLKKPARSGQNELIDA